MASKRILKPDMYGQPDLVEQSRVANLQNLILGMQSQNAQTRMDADRQIQAFMARQEAQNAFRAQSLANRTQRVLDRVGYGTGPLTGPPQAPTGGPAIPWSETSDVSDVIDTSSMFNRPGFRFEPSVGRGAEGSLISQLAESNPNELVSVLDMLMRPGSGLESPSAGTPSTSSIAPLDVGDIAGFGPERLPQPAPPAPPAPPTLPPLTDADRELWAQAQSTWNPQNPPATQTAPPPEPTGSTPPPQQNASQGRSSGRGGGRQTRTGGGAQIRSGGSSGAAGGGRGGNPPPEPPGTTTTPPPEGGGEFSLTPEQNNAVYRALARRRMEEAGITTSPSPAAGSYAEEIGNPAQAIRNLRSNPGAVEALQRIVSGDSPALRPEDLFPGRSGEGVVSPDTENLFNAFQQGRSFEPAPPPPPPPPGSVGSSGGELIPYRPNSLVPYRKTLNPTIIEGEWSEIPPAKGYGLPSWLEKGLTSDSWMDKAALHPLKMTLEGHPYIAAAELGGLKLAQKAAASKFATEKMFPYLAQKAEAYPNATKFLGSAASKANIGLAGAQLASALGEAGGEHYSFLPESVRSFMKEHPYLTGLGGMAAAGVTAAAAPAALPFLLGAAGATLIGEYAVDPVTKYIASGGIVGEPNKTVDYKDPKNSHNEILYKVIENLKLANEQNRRGDKAGYKHQVNQLYTDLMNRGMEKNTISRYMKEAWKTQNIKELGAGEKGAPEGRAWWGNMEKTAPIKAVPDFTGFGVQPGEFGSEFKKPSLFERAERTSKQDSSFPGKYLSWMGGFNPAAYFSEETYR